MKKRFQAYLNSSIGIPLTGEQENYIYAVYGEKKSLKNVINFILNCNFRFQASINHNEIVIENWITSTQLDTSEAKDNYKNSQKAVLFFSITDSSLV